MCENNVDTNDVCDDGYDDTCICCREAEEAGKSLLRRNLNHICNETTDKIHALHERNREAGLHPDCWEDTKGADAFNAMLKLCPELDKIYHDEMIQKLDTLYAAAELMEEKEFEELKKTDAELVESLLNGPQTAFTFPLDEESLKKAEELRVLLEEDGSKNTLLKWKMDASASETTKKIERLFNQNREAGLKPDDWSDLDENIDLMLEICPEFDEAYHGNLDKELDLLYEAAGLMEEAEFLEIKETDLELAKRLLSGPNECFQFTLDKKSQEEADRLHRECGFEETHA